MVLCCVTDDWYKIQSTTLPPLTKASQSGDKHDPIVANILHQQALEFAGNKSKSTFEDAYVHRCVSSMFKTIFQSDPLFDYDWAKRSLLRKRKTGSQTCAPKPNFVALTA
ncbi:hypothetical protein BJV82DRAFT_116449 [Fennellomyces sp. T-0311]|nr:hypothetical protein BJV82DRAFT_116449 [Fennellomyces sp. T-0311]